MQHTGVMNNLFSFNEALIIDNQTLLLALVDCGEDKLRRQKFVVKEIFGLNTDRLQNRLCPTRKGCEQAYSGGKTCPTGRHAIPDNNRSDGRSCPSANTHIKICMELSVLLKLF